MRKFLLPLLLLLVLIAPARADKVGAVIGGASGLVIAGPPGAIIGVMVGAIWGRPFWGPDESKWKCYLDDNFHRVCPRLPLR
jgi:hypothetical protein